MLCNLQELQFNLHSLLQELSDIQNRIVNPIQAKKSNTHSFLIKLPKVILILRVCPYLSQNDIVQLSTTCAGLRRSIYSPIGWKLLSRVLTPYPLIIKEIFVTSGKESHKFELKQADTFPIHMIEDQKLLKKARAECKKSLMQVYDKFKFKEEEHTELKRQLKSEKTNLKKLRLYKEYLQQKRNHLQQTNADYKTQLRLTNEGFSQKIKLLDAANEQLLKETTKLQNQKEALVGKIRQYQNEIQTIKADSQKSRQILKKIKNYLLYKEL